MVKVTRVLVIVSLVIAGFWLAARSVRPAAEGAARVAAVQMAAPAVRVGQSGDAQQVPDVVVVEATTVDVSAIPAGVYDPNNQYDRWQRGEIDLLENENILPDAEIAALRQNSERLPASGNISLAVGADGLAANTPAAGTSFDSIDYTECCGGGGNVPPDPELAVGPNHAIAVVNVAFEIYNKSGTSLVGPTTFSSFFASNPNCVGVFDPNALYDEAAGRYILGIDADGFYYCVAVSQTGNPTGSWNIYAFPTASGADFFDYPHAGVGRDAIYMGANIFGVNAFKESRVWAFDKTAMYSGSAAAAVSKPLPTTEDTPQPLNLHGFAQGTWPASGPHYFFTDTNFNGSTYSVWSWNNPFGATSPSLVGTVNLVTATGVAAGYPVDVPQSGGQTIQGNDFRPQDFEFRNGYAWSVSTIACNPGSGSVNCIRWAKINPATATVVDAGVYGSNGQFRFFGDLAVNHCDDMAVGYTKSSTSMWPSIFYTGRKSGDAAGTLQAEAQLKAGQLAYTAFDGAPRRWGDYTEMTIAPDGVTFWYLGEYSKNTGTNSGRWGTYIGSFTYADCTTGGPTPTPTNTPTVTSTPTNTPPSSSTVLHVADLDATAVLTNSGNRWKATVTIKAVNSSNAPVSGVTVKTKWSNGTTGNVSCTTNASGLCTVVKTGISKNKASVRLNVVKLVKSGYTYNASANSDPDTDSNGTWITVFKP
ncbi:MAG: Ig-like domain-containing protein [Candidatus Promineofilum sp.]|nr:Ig-like domain-containing protein [Promineifilum sp.]